MSGSGKKKAGTVPVRRKADGEWEVMLLSAISNPALYILPKGSVKKGEKGKEAAVRETLEEAGAIGRLVPGKIGQFNYETPKGKLVSQKMWLLEVTQELDDSDLLWMEREKRTRKWGTFDDARATVLGAPSLRPEILTILEAAEKHLHSTSTCSATGTPPPQGVDDA